VKSSVEPEVIEEVDAAVVLAHQALNVDEVLMSDLSEAAAQLCHALHVLLEALADRTTPEGNQLARLADRCVRIDSQL